MQEDEIEETAGTWMRTIILGGKIEWADNHADIQARKREATLTRSRATSGCVMEWKAACRPRSFRNRCCRSSYRARWPGTRGSNRYHSGSEICERACPFLHHSIIAPSYQLLFHLGVTCGR
jgi:hypothetical protein